MAPDNVARFTDNTTVARSARSIGALLVDAGKLSVEDAQRVLVLQRQQEMRFGDAALMLEVLTQADIDWALSQQFSYEYLIRGTSPVSESVIAAYDPFSAQVEAFRTLRSQLMLRWFDGDVSRRALAVVSADAKEGRSFVAANLAVVCSQLGERVLLIDADLRRPSQHTLFGLGNRSGLSALLSGREAESEAEIQAIPGLEHLSVLTAGAVPPNPIELLSRPAFSRLLNDLRDRFAIIVIDCPAAADFADSQTVAVRAGGSLIVARKNRSSLKKVQGLADALRQASSAVVGTILNEF
jgi:protein-tyrosine kinase